MPRTQIEKLLDLKLMEVMDLYRQYNPEGQYLSISMLDGYLHINNEHFPGGRDIDAPLDYGRQFEDYGEDKAQPLKVTITR